MFNQLYLIIEENKLKKRFKGNVVTAVLEVLNKETDVQRLELIYQTLWRFNDAIKFWDELIGYTSGDEEWEEYEKDLYSRYWCDRLSAHGRFAALHNSELQRH